MTPTLAVKTPSHPYRIHFLKDDFANSARLIKNQLTEDRLFIVSDSCVARLYRKKLDAIWKTHFKPVWLTFSAGEKYKTLATCEKLLIQLSKSGANRKSLILALGGGVAGDVAGFVASIYMRGIHFVQMPSTLLAQVDSAVGGKTGVDLGTGKNLAGSFYQPQAVYVHTAFLKTLPEREFRCGLAEVIKYGMIADATLFLWLKNNVGRINRRDPDALKHIIKTSLKIKARVVAGDEREEGQRAILNFGHTLGHAVETLSGYSTYSHGEAVAMGMIFATELSTRLGIGKPGMTSELTDLLKQFKLPVKLPPLGAKKYLDVIRRDKKAENLMVNFVLAQKIGKVKIQSLPFEELKQCLPKK